MAKNFCLIATLSVLIIFSFELGHVQSSCELMTSTMAYTTSYRTNFYQNCVNQNGGQECPTGFDQYCNCFWQTGITPSCYDFFGPCPITTTGSNNNQDDFYPCPCPAPVTQPPFFYYNQICSLNFGTCDGNYNAYCQCA